MAPRVPLSPAEGKLGSEVKVRFAGPQDLERIARIQASAPEASHWEPAAYLDYDCRVATRRGRVVGFLVSRITAKREREILSLAVDPDCRRQGVATKLIEDVLARCPGKFFLEVREFNWPARRLYRKLGFQEAGIRRNYYDAPVEAAIVMRFQS